MAKERKITIPCKAYVRKYIEALYGGQIRITHSSLVGIFLYALIEKKYYEGRHMNLSDASFVTQHYNDRISFVLSGFVFQNIGFDISPEKAMLINRFLEEQLEEHLFLYCDSYATAGKQRKQAIIDFAEKYKIDLEIDIGFDSLKKTEYRLRKKKERRKAQLTGGSKMMPAA